MTGVQTCALPISECGRLDLNQGNAIGYLNFKGKVEHIFVIVPNLEDFRIDRVHIFKLSRRSRFSGGRRLFGCFDCQKLEQGSRHASNDNVCRTTAFLISREDTQKAQFDVPASFGTDPFCIWYNMLAS